MRFSAAFLPIFAVISVSGSDQKAKRNDTLQKDTLFFKKPIIYIISIFNDGGNCNSNPGPQPNPSPDYTPLPDLTTLPDYDPVATGDSEPSSSPTEMEMPSSPGNPMASSTAAMIATTGLMPPPVPDIPPTFTAYVPPQPPVLGPLNFYADSRATSFGPFSGGRAILRIGYIRSRRRWALMRRLFVKRENLRAQGRVSTDINKRRTMLQKMTGAMTNVMPRSRKTFDSASGRRPRENGRISRKTHSRSRTQRTTAASKSRARSQKSDQKSRASKRPSNARASSQSRRRSNKPSSHTNLRNTTVRRSSTTGIDLLEPFFSSPRALIN